MSFYSIATHLGFYISIKCSVFCTKTHLVSVNGFIFCPGVNILQTCGKCFCSQLGCFELFACVCLVLTHYTSTYLKSLSRMPCRGHGPVSVCVCEVSFFFFIRSGSLSSVFAVRQRQTCCVLMTAPYVLQIQCGG